MLVNSDEHDLKGLTRIEETCALKFALDAIRANFCDRHFAFDLLALSVTFSTNNDKTILLLRVVDIH